eukprot:CAMPEP_0203806810 /NCGR_PEP_ID=MMETSP0115-20131106/707_1 /ASSEMBLY_ACC=CAM_ASM_000227 /TAXON_ID=33651 /ORGANISM="Bicosoecid sp, Strain ms1" /LENGTH=216 /DNA_ID=CAMNT_0050715477 /DNA_START=51 /DNA_END=701 /DNA_ORIENTATION=-
MNKQHPGGSSTAMVAGGKLTVHTTYTDGAEKVEDYDLRTDELLVRRWKAGGGLGIGGSAKWEYEVGEEGRVAGAAAGGAGGVAASGGGGGGDLIRAKSSTPVFLCRDSVDKFVWRFRNLAWPAETYKLSVDADKQQIVLRTTNKKYFKRIDVPALRRLEAPLDAAAISCEYDGRSQTLVVYYAKPAALLASEAEEREARRAKAKASKEGDVECKSQ